MQVDELLREALGRLGPLWYDVLADLDAGDLTWRPAPEANPIGWLAWHATRIVDDHVAHLAGVEQVWPSHIDGFDVGVDVADHGYGHRDAEVVRVAEGVAGAGAAALLAYVNDALVLAHGYLERVDAAELDRVVDDNWDPPVTAGVRFVSLLADSLQHAGQAAYLKGLLRLST